ncbi:GIY-YIG nuclease family protein [Turicimonas muris]|uniref:GIY-YIG nuclease family protein n=1 Tax=Turicimonas muris TaxID=1796652 RepID=UPI002674AC49|nr:GIY-YIG nuclease family protein [Turicimonas muris]
MKKDPKDNSTGFVYILTNPAFREDWIKIGRSSRRVDVRSKELDNTAVPLPFQIFATLQTSKYIEVEKLIHSMIDGLTSLRIRTNREFFNIKPEVALGFFHKVAETIDDAVVKQYKDNLPIGNENLMTDKRNKKKGHRRSRFKFSMVGIMPGEWVVFEPTKKRVKVVDDSKVRFEGKEYTLSRFASEFMPKEAQNSSGVYQGTRYFSYRGKNLVELRLGMQEKNESQQINVIDEIGTKPEVIPDFDTRFIKKSAGT